MIIYFININIIIITAIHNKIFSNKKKIDCNGLLKYSTQYHYYKQEYKKFLILTWSKGSKIFYNENEERKKD